MGVRRRNPGGATQQGQGIATLTLASALAQRRGLGEERFRETGLRPGFRRLRVGERHAQRAILEREHRSPDHQGEPQSQGEPRQRRIASRPRPAPTPR